MKRLKELLSKSYVRQVAFFLIIFIFVQLVILTFMFFNMRRSVTEHREVAAKNLITALDDTVNASVSQAEADLRALVARDIDVRLLTGQRENARVTTSANLMDTMNSYIRTSTLVDAYSIYSPTNDVFIMARSMRISYQELINIQKYIHQLPDSLNTEKTVWHVCDIDGKEYYIHQYYYNGCYYIALFKLDTFLAVHMRLIDNDSCLLLSDPEGNILAHIGDLPLPQISQTRDVIQYKTYVKTMPLTQTGLVASYVSSQVTGLRIDTFSIFIISICLSSLMLLVVFIKYLKVEVFQPVEELSLIAETVAQGDYLKRAELDCHNEEMQKFSQAMNNMISTIIHQKIDSYENELKQKELELKYLQVQLRPHHFLNTLSTISSMTYLGDTERIRNFIELYSRDARYLFSTSFKAVPLQEEIKHIQDYIDCQAILYPDCTFSFIDVAPDAVDWLVPQLMLHSLIENIYKHAVNPDSFTTFFLRASVKSMNGEQMLEIVIEDDGGGFPASVIEEINSSDGKLVISSHIGLHTINHTLFLMYGKKHLMQLSNKKDRGSIIRIWIPHDRINQEKGQ